jgi:hypothetical protein
MKWFSRLMGKEEFKIQTFTYYVPAPPPRKTGYREKEFDSLFYQFINRGYEVIEMKTVPHTGVNQCGMWIIILARALNPDASALDLDFEINNSSDNTLVHSLENSSRHEKEIELPSFDDEELESDRRDN